MIQLINALFEKGAISDKVYNNTILLYTALSMQCKELACTPFPSRDARGAIDFMCLNKNTKIFIRVTADHFEIDSEILTKNVDEVITIISRKLQNISMLPKPVHA